MDQYMHMFDTLAEECKEGMHELGNFDMSDTDIIKQFLDEFNEWTGVQPPWPVNARNCVFWEQVMILLEIMIAFKRDSKRFIGPSIKFEDYSAVRGMVNFYEQKLALFNK